MENQIDRKLDRWKTRQMENQIDRKLDRLKTRNRHEDDKSIACVLSSN